MNYILITPASNEERYIRFTLESVVKQTFRPSKYIVVVNNSKDATERIARSYSAEFSWIEVVTFATSGSRNFAAKAEAFNYAFGMIQDLEFDFIGNLDADVSLPEDYYLGIIRKFALDDGLGIAGGHYSEFKGGKEIRNFEDYRHTVGGMVQFFRKECFLEIGKYPAIPTGGIDAMAEFSAREKGWKVETFPEIRFIHRRIMGTAVGGLLVAKYKEGIRDYFNGWHPLFHLAKCVRRLAEPPIILGSLWRQIGYLSAMVRCQEIMVPSNLYRFIRQDQFNRLKALLPFRHGKGAER